MENSLYIKILSSKFLPSLWLTCSMAETQMELWQYVFPAFYFITIIILFISLVKDSFNSFSAKLFVLIFIITVILLIVKITILQKIYLKGFFNHKVSVAMNIKMPKSNSIFTLFMKVKGQIINWN